jgi:hypothetical protein
MNSILSVGTEIQLGTTASTIGMNSILVSGGGRLNTAAGIHNAIGVGTGASSNSVTVSGPGSIWNNAGSGGSLVVGDGVGSSFNSITISNGGLFVSTVTLRVGDANFNGSGSNNAYNVGGLGASSTATNGAIVIGGINKAAGGGFNTLTVTNATLVSTATTIGSGTTNNTGTVTAGGYWNLQGNALTVGSLTSASNVMTVLAGGILEAGTLATGAGEGNVITNSGGVYQFNTATPTITTNGNAGGSIFINGGVISFRGISSGLDLTNNTDATRLGRLTWNGDNAFRLNNSTATNTVVGGYTFQAGNPVNYARLEMVGGTNRIAGQSVTIGSSGSVLFSNTTASIGAIFTNSGAMTVVDSLVTFNTNCVLQGGSILWATNAASSNLISVAGTLTTSGSIAVNATGAVAGKPAQVTLIRVSGAIANNASWTVTPPTYSVKKQNQDLILKFSAQGTIVVLQ